MNIDKDIETLKQRLEADSYGGKCVLGYSEQYCFGTNDLQAIKNVLKELETWKKIAEKLSLYCNVEKMLPEKFCLEKERFNKCVKNEIQCEQCIIDWARKEVENEMS